VTVIAHRWRQRPSRPRLRARPGGRKSSRPVRHWPRWPDRVSFETIVRHWTIFAPDDSVAGYVVLRPGSDYLLLTPQREPWGVASTWREAEGLILDQRAPRGPLISPRDQVVRKAVTR
jgi:hypothetical protein